MKFTEEQKEAIKASIWTNVAEVLSPGLYEKPYPKRSSKEKKLWDEVDLAISQVVEELDEAAAAPSAAPAKK